MIDCERLAWRLHANLATKPNDFSPLGVVVPLILVAAAFASCLLPLASASADRLDRQTANRHQRPVKVDSGECSFSRRITNYTNGRLTNQSDRTLAACLATLAGRVINVAPPTLTVRIELSE